MTQTVVDVLEPIEIEKQHGEHVIGVTFRTLNFRLQQLGKHRAIRQTRQRIVERRVAEVFFRFFEHAADAFLFGYVSVELLNVTFRLLRAFVLRFGARTFGFFRVSRGRFHFAHVTVVAEVDDDDDWNADEKRPEARRAKTADEDARARRAREVTDRHPEKVATPRPPERLATFSGCRS